MEGIVTALIGLVGIIITVSAGYLIGRRQQKANTVKTETDTRISEVEASANAARILAETRIAEGVAEVANAKLAVETRLVEIEAKQGDLKYYQELVNDMQARTKERDAQRDIEQATLRGQVAAIEAVQAEAKNLHDSHITELLTSIEGMVASLGEADAKIVELQRQVSEGNERISGLQLTVEGSNETIAALQAQVLGLQEEMQKDKVVIAGLRQEIQGLLVQSVEKVEAVNVALTKALE